VPLPAATPAKRRGRASRALRTLGFFAVFGVPVLLAAFIASQSVYFVGTSDDGFVTLYRGLPYDLPAGIELYTPNFVSGVATAQLGAGRAADDRLARPALPRGREDLVRQIELGRLQGQAAAP
jgi:protein phosphatase